MQLHIWVRAIKWMVQHVPEMKHHVLRAMPGGIHDCIRLRPRLLHAIEVYKVVRSEGTRNNMNAPFHLY